VAGYIQQYWSPDPDSGLVARHRRGGSYRTYAPDRLCDRPLVVPKELAIKAANIERSIRGLSTGPDADGLAGVARFLLRSEAIASSMIEGIAPSPQQVALAELAQEEQIRGFGEQARLVANNITILRRATQDLVDADEVAIEDIVALHTALLPDDRHHGLRQVQNWIGGSNWHPLDAEFVPPPSDGVAPLLDDLACYVNGSSTGPLIQAALVHAQFETIHPFTDGNGRVGRALIHTVLARRGLAPGAVLPISLVLATLSDRYVDGLTSFRYEGSPDDPAAAAGVVEWLQIFVDAAGIASEQAATLSNQVAQLRQEWHARVRAHRLEKGLREAPRANSATSRLLELLSEAPVMTTRTVQRILGVSFPAARSALEELADAGVLRRKSVDRGTTGYLAREVLALVGLAERRLASTQFDTRASKPHPGAPALPGSPHTKAAPTRR
jgi:Fic family protein